MTDRDKDPPPEKTRNSALTIERIVAAAEEEFGTHGLDGAKIDDIARTAGISKQLIYHYFNGKDDLYSEMLSNIAERNYLRLGSIEYAVLSPTEGLRAFFECLFDIFRDNPFASTLTIDQGLHLGAQVRYSRHVERTREIFRNKLEELVVRGQQDGSLNPSLTPESVHFLAVVMVRGCVSLRTMFLRYTGKAGEADDYSALRAEYTEFFTRAVRA